MQLLSAGGSTPWQLATGIGCGVLILAGLWLFGLSDEPLVGPMVASVVASLIGLAGGALGSERAINSAACPFLKTFKSRLAVLQCFAIFFALVF